MSPPRPATPLLVCILIYALASAALYSGLLPPWEGFDELYHYGVVQNIANSGQILQDADSRLSRELWTSLDYLPISHYIQPYVERPSMSFEDYFHLTPEQRTKLRQQAGSMPREWRKESSPRVDYEAEQAPLTYILLAPLDAALARTSLCSRVLALRLFLSFLTIALLWTGARRFTAIVGLHGPWEAATLLAVFSNQMFYAEACRIGNDALAAPCSVWLLLVLIQSVPNPTWKRTVAAALLVAAGALLKTYLLIFIPLAFAVPLILLANKKWKLVEALQHAFLSAVLIFTVAGPWYMRALLKFHSLTPTVNTSGASVNGLLGAAARISWATSIGKMAHAALWTGNNSFVTFSQSTLNLVLILLVLALLLYLLRARRTVPESLTIAAVILYCAGLMLMAIEYFRSSGGLIMEAMPWYAPVLLVPVLTLGFTGLQRWLPAGRWIAMATVVLWSYVAAVSWIAKLIPLYGGFQDSHAHANRLLDWYLHGSAQRDSILVNLCPAPLTAIYLLLALVLSSLAAASVATLISLQSGASSES